MLYFSRKLIVLILFVTVVNINASNGYHVIDSYACELLNDRTKRQAVTCKSSEFRCASGNECIDGKLLCDGYVDCNDRSDETTDCEKISSGVKGCIVPTYPMNGYFNISGNIKLNPGEALSDGNYLTFACNPGYVLYPSTGNEVFYIICADIKWSAKFPACIRTCPPLISDSVDIECEFNHQPVDCEKPMIEKTFAKMKCKNHHQNHDLTYRNPLIRCKDGSWDGTKLRCVPDCGNLLPKSVQLYVIGGADAVIGDFPWHVGIYRKKKPVITDETKDIEHICGGSIITNRVVLSAARCFTDQINGKKQPEENYFIAAGKFFRDYSNDKDTSAQKTEVEKVIIPKEYRGFELRFDYDIALVVVKTPFSISNLVQPICVDWANEFEDEQLKKNSYGLVAGWGLTKEGAKIGATHLKGFKIPFIEREDCEATVPPDYKQFITPDKICAGFTEDSSVCKVDEGGGLVFEKTDKKFFIRGVLSNGPSEHNLCDREFGIYTKISKYLDWIAKVERDYKST